MNRFFVSPCSFYLWNIFPVFQQTARQILGGGVASIEEDEVEDEVQELGHAETYNDYMPVKCKYLSK
jgi:hypothetical protein